jgi:hypothetical protein
LVVEETREAAVATVLAFAVIILFFIIDGGTLMLLPCSDFRLKLKVSCQVTDRQGSPRQRVRSLSMNKHPFQNGTSFKHMTCASVADGILHDFKRDGTQEVIWR